MIMQKADNNIKLRQYFRELILLIFIVVIALVSIFWALYRNDNLVAPPITGSLSFDEKIFYISKNRILDKRDVIAVGSSMTLNNLASRIIIDEYSESYFNFSSWGLTIKQAKYYIKFLLDIYNPRVVIMVSSPVDFYYSGRVENFFNESEMMSYLLEPNYLQAYYHHFDPYYLIKNSINIWKDRSSNQHYQSLMFDQNGGVTLDMDINDVNLKRWDTAISPQQIDQEAYTDLRELAIFLRNKGVKYVFIQPPMRQHAVEGIDAGLDMHWNKISGIAEMTGMYFINLHRELNFDDTYFVDYCHLNHVGAIHFTKRVVKSLDRLWLNKI